MRVNKNSRLVIENTELEEECLNGEVYDIVITTLPIIVKLFHITNGDDISPQNLHYKTVQMILQNPLLLKYVNIEAVVFKEKYKKKHESTNDKMTNQDLTINWNTVLQW